MNIGEISYSFAALTALILIISAFTRWRRRAFVVPLTAVSVAGFVWSLAGVLAAREGIAVSVVSVILELLHDFLFLLFLVIVLKSQHLGSFSPQGMYRLFINVILVMPIAIIALVLFVSSGGTVFDARLGYDARIIGQVIVAIGGLVLIEQFLRNLTIDTRWSLKFMALGSLLFFAYNLYFYADALLFGNIDIDIALARGLVFGVANVLLMIGLSRSPASESRMTVSRPVVFYSTALVMTGGFLIVIATAGFYFRSFGGDWAKVSANTFVFVALIGLVAAIFSDGLRARLRVFIDKHFLNYKYDYRIEWQGMIRRLSAHTVTGDLEDACIQSLADIVDSQGGSLWLRKNKDEFHCVSARGMAPLLHTAESTSGSLANFLETWQWVINVVEYNQEPAMYSGLELPEWVRQNENIWLIVPLMLQTRLYGFIVLLKSRAVRPFNWEDIDLLKTAGRQVSIYLAQNRAGIALAQSRQFEAFSRLSAYVMHDLKNLMSQLGLVVKNAERHKNNPAFVDDAIKTVGNSVERMNRLMAQLRAGSVAPEEQQRVNLIDVVNDVINDKQHHTPCPTLETTLTQVWIYANRSRLISVIGHIVQNALDATPRDGAVRILVRQENSLAIVEVVDSGCGMDEKFIEERLFKPFDTTKGLTGMGIGAHDAKNFIENIGGHVVVESALGKGTRFIMKVPTAIAESN